VKRRSRIFWVDEDEQLHRIPEARYHRIYDRTQAIYLYAGKTIRFVYVVLEVQEGEKLRVIAPCFHKCMFDAVGYLDQGQKKKQLMDAVKVLEVSGKSDWQELYRMEYIEPHSWKPSDVIIEQLKVALQKEG
jgi:hypothetical protein